MSDQMIRTEMLGAIPRVDTNKTDPYFLKVNSNGCAGLVIKWVGRLGSCARVDAGAMWWMGCSALNARQRSIQPFVLAAQEFQVC